MNAHGGALFLAFAAILVMTLLFRSAARRIGQPPVVGEIIAGILAGPTLFHGAISATLFQPEIRPQLTALANVGLAFFMFILGVHFARPLGTRLLRDATSVAIGSVVLPAGLGVLLAVYLAGHHRYEGSFLSFAVFIGTALSVTAFPVLARILQDRGMNRTCIGDLALASASVTDLIAWSMLAIAVTISAGSTAQWRILLVPLYGAIMLGIVRPALRGLTHERVPATARLLILMICLFASCAATEWMGIHFVFGAFFFGVMLNSKHTEALRQETVERLDKTTVVLLPVFFVTAGLNVNLSSFGATAIGDLALVLAAAVFGKVCGAFAGARLRRLPTRESAAIAALMNTRGLTELVVLTIGRQLGLLDPDLYSVMVVMAVLTTMMAGPSLNFITRRGTARRGGRRKPLCCCGTCTADEPTGHDSGRLPAPTPA